MAECGYNCLYIYTDWDKFITLTTIIYKQNTTDFTGGGIIIHLGFPFSELCRKHRLWFSRLNYWLGTKHISVSPKKTNWKYTASSWKCFYKNIHQIFTLKCANVTHLYLVFRNANGAFILKNLNQTPCSLNYIPLDACWWEPEGGSQSDSESEGGDQPSAENSASSGPRSTWLNKPRKNNPKKSDLKRKEDRKKEKKSATCSKLLFTAIWKELSSGVFFASTTRETPPKHKVEREKCEATGLCVCNQAPGFPINPCSTVQWYVNMDYYCF